MEEIIISLTISPDGLYPKQETFIQSISIPQGLKAVLFVQHQEAAQKDVERAFGVLQPRFAIVKNPTIFQDNVKIGRRTDGYTQFDVSEFQQIEDNGSSHVDLTYSTDISINIANMMDVRTRIHDRQMPQQVKVDLVEHVWLKFGREDDNN